MKRVVCFYFISIYFISDFAVFIFPEGAIFLGHSSGCVCPKDNRIFW